MRAVGENVRILGPIEVWSGEKRLDLGGPRQVALLGFLVVHANRAVSSDVLIEALWDRNMRQGFKPLQMAVARLRRAIEPLGKATPVIRTVAGGYLLSLSGGDVDADAFESNLDRAREALDAGQAERAAEFAAAGLSRWRGPPLAEVAYEDFAQPEIRRLTELRLLALETRVEADLALGRHLQLTGELTRLVAEHPGRERLARQLMLALYQAGRQQDALEVFARTRLYLSEELGLSPGPELEQLQRRILEQRPEIGPNSAALTVPIAAAGNGGGGSSLPTLPTPTVGRDRELETLVALIASSDLRLLTLIGPGGVGKTRLALAVARELERAGRDVRWLDLSGVSRPEDVDAAFVRGVGASPLPDESALDALRRELRARRCVLVVDNVEHVIERSPLIGELLRVTDGLTVLATSRQRLDLQAEHCVWVHPLSLPSGATLEELEESGAGAMFLAAARRRSSELGEELSPEAVAAAGAVCSAVDGLPLALELAASRLGFLGLRELAATLGSALTLAGSRDAPRRQQTLEATVDWSYRLLTTEEQTAFRRFAVFAGGASLAAAAEVLAAPIAVLEGLAAKSVLVRRSGDRVTRLEMLHTIRQYALSRLAEDPDAPVVHRRHCRHYVDMVERCGPLLSTRAEQAALAELESDADNILAGLRWALDHAPHLALRLAGSLGEYWLLRNRKNERQWLTAALEAAGNGAPEAMRARAYLWRASLANTRTERVESIEDATKALELYRREADDAGIAHALCELAVGVGVVHGRLDEERRLAEEACHHARLAGDDRRIGHALAVLAAMDPERRADLLSESAAFLWRAGDVRLIVTAYTNAAYVALLENRPDEAHSLLAVALETVGLTDSPHLEAYIHGNLGLAKLFTGGMSEARAAFGRQLSTCLDNALPVDGEGLAGMAAVAVSDETLERAARLLGASRAAGYPPTLVDDSVTERLNRRFFHPARQRLGEAAWDRLEQEGETLDPVTAAHLALQHLDGVSLPSLVP